MRGQHSDNRLRYVAAIDGLRAVAISGVILFNLWPGLLPGGFTGVDIFFVISGFVVTGSLLGRRFDSLGQLAAYFYARRLMRIVPALIAMLLATTLASQLFIPRAWLSNSLAQLGRFAFFGLSNIVLATDTASAFGPEAAYNPFTHSWSLGVEEQFYLAFPFLLYWHHRVAGGLRAIRMAAALSAASLLLCAVLSVVAVQFAYYLILTRFWELGVGMLLCLTADRWGPKLAAGSWPAQLGLAFASAALAGAGLMLPEARVFPAALLPVIGGAGLIASVCASPRTPVARLLAAPPMVGVGLVSYSLYLWHWPVIVLFRWTTGLVTLRFQLLALALTALLALLSYFLVERPLRLRGSEVRRPHGRVVAGVLSLTLVAALSAHLLIGAHDRITLSVTGDRAAWYADPDRPLDPSLTQCDLHPDEQRIAGGMLALWTPDHCRAARAGFTLFVAGDSHGQVYVPALRQFAAEEGAPVRLYSHPRCSYLELTETHAVRRGCQVYYEAVLADIRAASKPGDVIFLPGLRIPRFANQFEADADNAGARQRARVEPGALAEARALLAALARTGAALVIEAPKPLFRSPAFRCSDWFNRRNPTCRGGATMSRPELLERRASVLGAMQTLAAEQPALTVWDPFPVLCPADPCQAMPGGHPLFFDGDHLSGLGNDLLYPDLRNALLAVRARTRAGTAPSPAPEVRGAAARPS